MIAMILVSQMRGLLHLIAINLSSKLSMIIMEERILEGKV
jgi:hypothetical protein